MPKFLNPDSLWSSDDPLTLHRNVEVKAKCRDLAAARRRAIKLGAKPAGRLDQTDTYFHVRRGRLKLRETLGKAATLIAYDRSNRSGARDSRYRVVRVPDPAALQAALSSALGVKTVVRKRRDLLIYRNVRIHLDRVAALGDFVELEAVVGPIGDAVESRRRIAEVVTALKIERRHRIGGSYSDLVPDRAGTAAARKREHNRD